MKYKKSTHARGEKWETVLFTEIDVGNARPFIESDKHQFKNIKVI
jgi:hypothetical protein